MGLPDRLRPSTVTWAESVFGWLGVGTRVPVSRPRSAVSEALLLRVADTENTNWFADSVGE